MINLDEKSKGLLEASPARTLDRSFPFDTNLGGSLTASVFRQENLFGSYFQNKDLQRDLELLPPEEGFNYENNIPEDLWEYADRFVGAESRDQAQRIAFQIRKEISDKQNMANHPVGSLFLGFVAGNADPTLLMPGGTFYKSAKASYGIAKSAASVGVATLAQSTLQEIALAKTQQVRELEESVYNVMSATLFGSVIGGIGGAFASGVIGKKIRSDISSTYAEGYGAPKENTLSAADVDPSYIHESNRIASNVGEWIAKIGKLTPFDRMRDSKFTTVKDFVDNLYEHNLVKNKNTEAFGNQANPIATEVEIKKQFGSISKTFTEYQDIFFDQAGIKRGPFKPERAFFSKQGLTFDEFDSQVGRALRRGDEDANPHVAKAAQLLRTKVFEPLKEAAIELNMLPKNVDTKTAISYFMRVYNRQRIKENENAFKATIRPWFVSKNNQLKALMPTISGYGKRISLAKAAASRQANKVKEIERLKGLKSGNAESIETRLKKEQEELDLFIARKEKILENRKTKNLDILIQKESKKNDLLKRISEAKEQYSKSTGASKKEASTKIKKLESQVKTLEKQMKHIESEQLKIESKDEIIKDKDVQIRKERLDRLKEDLTATVRKIKNLEASVKKLSPDVADARLKNLEKELEDIIPFDLKDSDGKLRRVLEDDQIDVAVDKTVQNILGRNDQKLLNPMMHMIIGQGKTKPLHNRVFLIPDEIIEDYLLNSATKVADLYSKAMIPTIELNKLARRTMEPVKRSKKLEAKLDEKFQLEEQLRQVPEEQRMAIEQEIARVNDEITALEQPPTPGELQGQLVYDTYEELQRLKRGKSPEEAAKLEKEFDRAVEDIKASFDMLAGVYGQGPNVMDTEAAKVARNILTWNFVRLMGFMTISSLPDLGMHILRHGPMAFMREGLMPVLRQLEGAKLNKEMLQDMGRAIESLSGQRLKSMLDHEGTALETGLFGKALDYVAGRFGNAALMNQWQDMNQFIAGNMSMSRTLRVIDAWFKTGKMKPRERERLALLRIPEEHWRTIHKEWKKTGGIDGGSYYCNWGDWATDIPEVSKAYEAFRSGVLTEVDSTVVMPGLADKPTKVLGIEFNSILGSFLLQFKRFAIASTKRVLISGLSERDASFYMGSVAMLGIGAMGYVITSKLRRPNEEVDLSWDKLTKEAIDRSGLPGIFMEGFNIADKLLGSDGVSRYQSRGLVGMLAGPSAGLAEDVAYLLNKATRAVRSDGPELTTKDAEKFIRLMPFQNLFYLYYLNRQVTHEAALGLGFEEQ